MVASGARAKHGNTPPPATVKNGEAPDRARLLRCLSRDYMRCASEESSPKWGMFEFSLIVRAKPFLMEGR